jgi:hypothetical protein
MSWRLARSLEQLRDQLDRAAPNRSRRSDGTIGDTAHQTRKSDHNPDDGGVVRAIDITDDPAGGLSCEALAEALRGARDGRVKYVIWNHRMFSSYGNSKRQAWQWGEYTGANPHAHHIHISILPDAAADTDTGDWSVAGGSSTTTPSGQPQAAGDATPKAATPKAATTETPSTKDLAAMMPKLDLREAATTPVKGEGVRQLQGLLLAAGYGPDGLIGEDGRPDGSAGSGTRTVVGEFQTKTGTGKKDGSPDYVVGEATWKALLGL